MFDIFDRDLNFRKKTFPVEAELHTYDIFKDQFVWEKTTVLEYLGRKKFMLPNDKKVHRLSLRF